jgi:hypothetical protein
MSTPDNAPVNSRPPEKLPTPVIRRGSVAEVDPVTLKKQVPAWLISVAIHVVLIVPLYLIGFFTGAAAATVGKESQVIESNVADQEEKQDFANTEVGIDPSQQTQFDIARIEDVSVPGPLKPDEPVGMANAPDRPAQTVPPPPGFGDNSGQGAGAESDLAGKASMIGAMGGMGGKAGIGQYAFRGASGATRQRMITEGGGNTASEAAVARGLQWLVKMQKADGRWSIDGSNKDDVAGTALALLPFLAAGQTHKSGITAGNKPSPYVETVRKGINWLRLKQKTLDGSFSNNMYTHAIATLAVCEAYGMTGDPTLKGPAQMAIKFIERAQHNAGGWRYAPNQPGDTSVTGWQVQALKSGQLGGLTVDKAVMDKVDKYLDSVAGEYGARYGYTDKNGSPAMTAVGLLCRQYRGWGPKNPRLAKGVEYLKTVPPKKDNWDIYYYYYATQVVHFFGGDDWFKFWNPKMRDTLIELQVVQKGPNEGSWDPDQSITGGAGGRLVATCLSLLTLEVYYRHLPLYKRDDSGKDD